MPAQCFQNPVLRLTGRGVLESEVYETVHLVFDIGHGRTICTIKLVSASNQGLILSQELVVKHPLALY